MNYHELSASWANMSIANSKQVKFASISITDTPLLTIKKYIIINHENNYCSATAIGDNEVRY